MRALAIIFFALALPALAASGAVEVKYRGPVSLAPFTCTDLQSSFIRRICYDRAEAYMLIDLSGTWYHYCEIDAGTVDKLLKAESAGRFFNGSIKGSGKDGQFDCRTHRQPGY